MRKQKHVQGIHMRHEESAAFAAGAEAHLTGKLAICAGSCGPGNLHLIHSLYDCHRSRVPVLAIAAQIPSGEIGSGDGEQQDDLMEPILYWLRFRLASFTHAAANLGVPKVEVYD